ncbi:hypothetical protein AMAG_15374 [Allomyces macrogynus ATCC 38327]|uniref:EF-hand domain-containing protein n=1 Tax=Allomyces macrogynus (strain ATCC 38327) TaxID=578462 RepID=A0A0L0T798_ALLM3|nr:hypothetical protein AMAG_15374 [Allomyces macrogynus ATCC 38327]|eukprot:KNE70617.1 hypothetical protein AMAG_15374 [Allomyces macrogynus ATCC 38327]
MTRTRGSCSCSLDRAAAAPPAPPPAPSNAAQGPASSAAAAAAAAVGTNVAPALRRARAKDIKLSDLPLPPDVLIDSKHNRTYYRHELLGTGGFARCYRVTDDNGRELAAKVVARADRETLTPRDAVRALVRVVHGSELPVDDDAQLVEELAAAVAGATRRDARLDARALDRVAHLLALPPARMRVAAAALDADGDGLLTLREFQAALAGGVPIESSAPPTGLLATWFGTDGKGTVRVADLAATLARARAALTRLQFTAHAVDAVMPLERYAWLVAAAATTAVGDVVEHARMVDRVDRVRGKWAHERGITMDDYVAFDALARHADRLVVAMRHVPARCAAALDVTLSPTQVAVLFDLLDADGDGRLALAEFRTLARRFRHHGSLPPSVTGPCATAPVGPTPLSVRVRAWWRCALTGVPPADDDDSESIDDGTAALIIFTGGPAAVWNDATEVVAAE